MKPLFSIVLIARNEAQTLPRLVASLKEFQSHVGEIILLDTGSTDGTADIARGLGCRVTEAGERFYRLISTTQAAMINARFVAAGELAVVEAGQGYFDYSAARNFAAALATNDMIATPDCDEVFTIFDIDKINAAIARGIQQLEYHFVFSHLPDGRPDVQFMHSKFYDRRVLTWCGVIHEVLQGGAVREYVDFIRLEHWQNPATNRSGYLKGLAVDCFEHPDNDRNSHYFGRELFWSGRHRSAIKELTRHVAMDRWPAERSQSAIFIGDAHEALGELVEAVAAWRRAAEISPQRREPLMRLARHYWKLGDKMRAAQSAAAAAVTPWNNYYGNQACDYGAAPHEILYWATWPGDISRYHWARALELEPNNPKYIRDWTFYNTGPTVSIVIPTLGREKQLDELVKSIPALAGYPVEIIVERDSFADRKGVAEILRRGVERASGDLILFLGNDCKPHENFVIEAVRAMAPPYDSFVALNDGVWDGKLATHWLAARALLPALGGAFFHDGYAHVGCDNELTARAKALGKYIYAPRARVAHDILDDEVRKVAWDPASVARDRALLAKRLAELRLVEDL